MKTIITALLLLVPCSSIAAPLPAPKKELTKELLVGEWQLLFGKNPDPKGWIIFYEDGTYLTKYSTTTDLTYFGFWSIKDKNKIVVAEARHYDEDSINYDTFSFTSYIFVLERTGGFQLKGTCMLTSLYYANEVYGNFPSDVVITRVPRNSLSRPKEKNLPLIDQIPQQMPNK